MSKEAKKRATIISLILVSVFILVVTLSLLFVTLNNDKNEEMDTTIGEEYTYRDSQGTWTWYINSNNETATVKSYSGSASSVTIPNIIVKNGISYSVTDLSYSRTNSNSTNIKFGIFDGNTSVIRVTIPNSVTRIGDHAFRFCDGLTSVEIPNSVTSIGSYAFDYCSGLTSVEIPNSVISLGSYAFSDCTGISSMTIPEGVTSIGWRAFFNCSQLSRITLPNSLTGISDQVFGECRSLNYNIYNGTKCLGNSTNPYLVCVAGVTSASSINMHPNTKLLPAYAFRDFTSLSSVTIGSSITSLPYNLFYNSKGPSSITIPSSVTSINCDLSGKTMYYMGTLEQYCGVSFSSGCNPYVLSGGKIYVNGSIITGDLVIPNGVTKIGSYTFYACSSLTSVTIPNSVTNIGSGAFRSCRGLTSVDIPNSVVSIGENTFAYCSSLTSVYFLHDYTSGIKASYNDSNPNHIGLSAFTNGNSNVTYYFINQASRDNAYNITYQYSSSTTYTRSNYFTGDNFELMTPQFNVEVNNSDWGSVAGNTNPGLNTSTTLTAVPNEGYYFQCWLKNQNRFDEGREERLTVKYIDYVTYTAVFVATSYDITVISQDETMGTVDSGGILAEDREFLLTATPILGYKFVKWLKNDEDFDGNKANPFVLTVTENATYTAIFEIKYCSVIINNPAYKEGAVSDVSGVYQAGTQLSITATPGNTSKFLYYLKDDKVFSHSLDQSFTFIVTEDVIYTVIFAPLDTYIDLVLPNSIILETEYQGDETTNTEVCGIVKTYGYGDMYGMQTVRVEAIATSGYRFVGWKINGETTISAKYTTATADILLADIPNSKIIIAVFDKVT